MKIGVLTLELSIPGNDSLKGKRSVLRSIKDRIRGGFNASVAEVEGQDTWQRAVLGVACVGSDQKYINGQLSRIRDLVAHARQVELVDCEMEFL